MKKKIEIGDYLLCKKSRYGGEGFKNESIKYITKGKYYKVENYSDIDKSFIVIGDTNQTISFNDGKVGSYYHNTCDYFFTIKESRRLKLNIINGKQPLKIKINKN